MNSCLRIKYWRQICQIHIQIHQHGDKILLGIGIFILFDLIAYHSSLFVYQFGECHCRTTVRIRNDFFIFFCFNTILIKNLLFVIIGANKDTKIYTLTVICRISAIVAVIKQAVLDIRSALLCCLLYRFIKPHIRRRHQRIIL